MDGAIYFQPFKGLVQQIKLLIIKENSISICVLQINQNKIITLPRVTASAPEMEESTSVVLSC